MKAFTFLARRFVAGETAEAAIAAGVRLKARGINATFDLLGEDVLDREAARRSAEANKHLLRLIPEGVERNISIKLSMMGLDIAEDFCLEQTAGILQVAREVGGFVRIDMEGSKHTQRTLDAFQRLRRDYLHRTEQDVKEAIGRGDRVRICKGAYKEPPEIAFQDMDDIRANYLKCARLLLEKAHYPAMATHDEKLVGEALAFTAQNQIASSRYEFQMLYGLRPKRWDELVAAGHNMRIYVPYGTHWFPYFYRRLRERRENVLFVLRSLFGG